MLSIMQRARRVAGESGADGRAFAAFRSSSRVTGILKSASCGPPHAVVGVGTAVSNRSSGIMDNDIARRDFLKAAPAAAGVLAMGLHLSATAPEPEQPYPTSNVVVHDA